MKNFVRQGRLQDARGDRLLGVSFISLLVFIGLIPFETSFLRVEGLGATVTRLLGVWIVIAWALTAVIQRRQLIFRIPMAMAVVFFAWAAVSLIWAWDKQQALQSLISGLQLLALCFVVANEVTTLRRLRFVLLVLFIACLAASAAGLLGLGVENKMGLRSLQGQGAKEYGSYAGIALLTSGLLFVLGAQKTKVLAGAAALAAGVALLASGERGVALAIALACVATLLVLRQKAMPVVLASLALVLGMLLVPLLAEFSGVSEDVKSRFNLSHVLASGGTGRTDIWTVGLGMVSDNLLLGTGLGNFRSAAGDYGSRVRTATEIPKGRDPHADWLDVVAGLGLPGLGLFGALLFATAWTLIKLLRRSQHPGKQIEAILVFSLFVYVLSIGLASTYMWRKVYWLVLGMAMAYPVALANSHRVVRIRKPLSSWVKRWPRSGQVGVAGSPRGWGASAARHSAFAGHARRWGGRGGFPKPASMASFPRQTLP